MRDQRGYLDLGPDWLWCLFGWLALIGACSLLAGAGAAVWWLSQHVRFA